MSHRPEPLSLDDFARPKHLAFVECSECVNGVCPYCRWGKEVVGEGFDHDTGYFEIVDDCSRCHGTNACMECAGTTRVQDEEGR